MSKTNEPVKLVFPNQQQRQPPQHHPPQQPGALAGAGQQRAQQQHRQQQSQSVVVSMNNRVTFTSQTLANGTINLSNPQQQQQQHHQHLQTSSSGMTMLSAAGPTVMKPGGQQPHQQSHIVIQKQGHQNTGQSSMMPGVQILNMRPGAPVNQHAQQQQQKTVAAVSPRVVTHMVGPRPPNSGGQPQQQQQITLTTLQNLQQSGASGAGAGQQQAILLKTESGQFQLLRVGPSPASAAGPGGQQQQQLQQSNSNTSASQTIRLQTVPAQQTIATSSSGQSLVVNSAGHTQTIQHIQQNQLHPPQPQSAQQQQQQTQPQQQPQQQQQPPPPIASVAPVVAASNSFAPPSNHQQNTKEKCRKFLANLLELSSREPRPVEHNVRQLIQELIDANVEPELFCERLEKLLNASPQPCLIGFLKKSLPLLRQSLATKELIIDGIHAPPHNVAFGGAISANIPAQVRPISQPQMRMVGQAQPRPIGHTTITRHTAPVRIQGPGPRLINAIVRPGTIVHNNNNNSIHHQSTPPALQPVGATMATFAPGGAQIRPPRTPAGLQIRHTVSKQPAQQMQPMQQLQTNSHVGKSTITKVGSTQIKQITTNGPSTFPVVAQTSTGQPVAPAAPGGATSTIPTIPAASVAVPPPAAHPSIPTPTTTTAPPPATPTTKSSAKSTAAKEAAIIAAAIASAKKEGAVAAKDKEKKAAAAAVAATAAAKEKEKKTAAAAVAAAATARAAAASGFYPQSSALSMASYGDDDINDVAAMGGVNLAEESQQILGSTELIGTQIRSCKDEVFLHMPALQARIRTIMARHGLDEAAGADVAVLISHATQERLRNVVEKLAVIAEHRIDIIKIDPRYEVTKDVRGQIKFLEELDKAEQKRHEEQEREMLMRAAKSRSKTEDPEQVKLKAKAKEMQRVEMEEVRQRDANLTALQAIGPRKKPKLETDATAASTTGEPGSSKVGAPPTPLRPRIKRVNLKDMVFYMEQERDTCRSTMLYKAYLK